MAAASLPRPGTELGPCGPESGDCSHIDCEATRHIARKCCTLCGDPIGYETRFYNDPNDGNEFVHAGCLERKYHC